ncbi:hypothetical protein, partial [Microbacterium sp. p3-SID336]|uniref:hypothetical protein n=1 Tax=Microbacterium sp. p3-SID336 TaxID=2916212 RepID=UPI0021A4B835
MSEPLLQDAPETFAAPLLTGAHRVIRVLDGAEGPFDGVLVTDGDRVVLRRSAEEMAGWEGWRFAGAQHVLGPLDVARRGRGHDVLLPWCTERVGELVGRRTSRGRPLSSGEATTIVASLLRGTGELVAAGRSDARGTWWLTDDGRPLFAIGAGDEAIAAAAEIVDRIAESTTDRPLMRVLARVATGLREHNARTPARLLQSWEQEVLATAAPRALASDTGDGDHSEPARAREVARALVLDGPAVTPTRVSLRTARQSERTRQPWHGRSAEALRDMLAVAGGVFVRLGRTAGTLGRTAGTLRGVVSSRERRPRGTAAAEGTRPRASRRRVLLLAGAGAAVVLAGGLLWPAGDGAEGARGATSTSTAVAADTAVPQPDPGTPRTQAAASASPSLAPDSGAPEHPASSTPEPSAPVDSGDPIAAVYPLLAAVDACRTADDEVCAGTIEAGASGVVAALADAGPDPLVELVDEYGGVAVLQITRDEAEGGDDMAAGEETSRRMVLV